jgi:OmcA/MtrC family decaheme c-type cytochrome
MDLALVHNVQPPAPETAYGTEVDINDMSPTDLAGIRMTAVINSVSAAANPVMNFTVTDQFGRAVTGLGAISSGTTLRYLRFAIARLVPGAAGSPDRWESYMITSTSRPSTENTGAVVDNGNGTYSYTFVKNITTVPTVTYDATLTHRAAMQISISGNAFPAANETYDYRPDGNPVTLTRDIVETSGCFECHQKFTFHGEGRQDAKYCNVCHTYQRAIGRTASSPTGTGLLTGSTYIVNGQTVGEFVTMTHKIHRGNGLTLQGYNYANVLFNEIGYPQNIINCRKCHSQSAVAPQGDNFKNKPSRLACGACHDNISFEASVPTGFSGHSGGPQADDSLCAGCHSAADIESTYHLTDNYTPNNPNVPAGAQNFTYEISSATVTASTQPVITFRILSAPSTTTIGTPVTLVCNTSSSTSNNRLLTGFSGSPSFLIAYALPQDGVSTMIDYNNLGKTAGQPASVSIANICNQTQGSMSGPDVNGYYTATVTSAAGAFPAGSALRAVALQGYFTQSAGTSGLTATTARHTISAYKAVTGDTARRSIVDNAKCFNCHEWFEGHGGNRVYTTEVCVMCHIPNLSTSGRGANVANLDATNAAALAADGYDPANPSTWPEASNNFKDMIHGIHAAHERTTPYQFVRDRGTSGVFYYNWSHVTFPGILNNCETCHKAGTAGGYDGSLPAGVLPTTNVTTDGNAATTVAQDRASVPNANDVITSPTTATCIACHDSDSSRWHMEINGGTVDVPRSTGQ